MPPKVITQPKKPRTHDWFFYSPESVRTLFDKQCQFDPTKCTTLVIPPTHAIRETEDRVIVRRQYVTEDGPPIFCVLLQLEKEPECRGFVLRAQLVNAIVKGSPDVTLMYDWCTETMPDLNHIQLYPPTITSKPIPTLLQIFNAAPYCMKWITQHFDEALKITNNSDACFEKISEDRLATLLNFLVNMQVPWCTVAAYLQPFFAHLWPLDASAVYNLGIWKERYDFQMSKGVIPRGCRRIIDCKLCPYSQEDVKVAHKECGARYLKHTNVLEINMNTLTTAAYTKTLLSIPAAMLDW